MTGRHTLWLIFFLARATYSAAPCENLLRQRYRLVGSFDWVKRPRALRTFLPESGLAALMQIIRSERGMQNSLFSCESRAHAIALYLEHELRLRAWKVFAIGARPSRNILESDEENTAFDYHVAVLLYVEKHGLLQKMVIDYPYFSTPVTYEAWRQALRSKRKRVNIFHRAAPNFYPGHITNVWSGYDLDLAIRRLAIDCERK